MKIYLAGGGVKAQIIREINENMKLYLAGEHDVKNGKEASDRGNNGLFILESFFYARKNSYIGKIIPTCGEFLLDSGAFTFRMNLQNATRSTWEKYTDEYAEFVNAYNIQKYIEMDIDSLVGIKEVEMLSDALGTENPPLGMAFSMTGRHMCKESRGARKQGVMTSTYLTGVFKENDLVRAEFMAYANK